MRIKFSTWQSISGILYVLPVMLVLALMMVYPLIQTIAFSFSNIGLPKFDLQFAGLANFRRIFAHPDLTKVILNTLFWTFGSLLLRFTLGMISALIMNTDVPGIGIIRICVLLPWTVPTIVAANTWRWMLQGDFGVFNGMLKAWGLGKYAFAFLTNPMTAMPSVLTTVLWAGYPFIMMMLLSAMQGLPKEFYEAATVDGANVFQRFWYITIPGIKPVLMILLALETISAINSFDLIYTMTGGGPGNATEILGLFVYRLGFKNLDFAGASVVSVVMIIIALLFFVLYMLTRRTVQKSEVLS
jgi:multiple sugar transport system permease protein